MAARIRPASPAFDQEIAEVIDGQLFSAAFSRRSMYARPCSLAWSPVLHGPMFSL
jgi:hypothetical protein